MSADLPVLAIVSNDIRRDLIAPLRWITRFRVIHLYRTAPYNDLTPQDWDDTLIAFSSPADLRRKLDQYRVDIVQNMEILAMRQWPYVRTITAFAAQRRIPLFAGTHISLPLRQKYGLLPAFALKILLQPTIRCTRLFFYLNEGARRNLHWAGAPDDRLIRLMYGTWGVDLQEFSPIPDGSESPWGADAIFFAGRLHREKGLFDLLEALPLVRRDHPGVRLYIAGDGPHRAEAEVWVRQHHLEDAVTFLGAVKHRNLPPYFRSSAVFCCPSHSHRKWEEYVGMTNLQALACGVPVVSTRSGAIPEYIPPTAGILVPERQPPMLADALSHLLSDAALRARMGQAGRSHAAHHYSARRNVELAEEQLIGLVP